MPVCRCVVSGAGKVATCVLEKLITFGAIPVTISGKVIVIKTFNPIVPTQVTDALGIYGTSSKVLSDLKGRTVSVRDDKT